MPSLGSLWYTMGIRDLTDADLKKINDKLKNAGSELLLNPKLNKDINKILPKGLKLELDPKLNAVTNETLAKAVEGKVMHVEVMPLLTHLRKALKDATLASPAEIEVGVNAAKLRDTVTRVLNNQGFMLNISTVNDNYSKAIQQKLNGTTYTVKIHADAKEIARSVQASLMQVQSRYFGLQVSKDVLRNSIDNALMGKPFNIQIAVMHDQARRAVQNALNNARMVGKDDALAFQRLKTGELKAAQAELARLRAEHYNAASAAKAHASASINLGGAMGSNIKIAGELGSAMASLYSIHAAKEFLSQVIEIGGKLEHQKIAMDTIFGDKGKTNELFGQIKDLARQSPFGVMELTKSVKALSAYGVEYNEIYDTAKRLADISAATSVDINRLILAFGKTKSRGFLDGLEAKQFAYANIPIYEMVRKKLEELEGQAVTTADVMARMKKREIGFDIVKDVLWDITDEGGKFYNMQEALAGSVKTSWKLVRDNIELMFGEIAESSVGDALKDVAVILQGSTRNWRTMGSAIAGAVITLGVFKTAILAHNVVLGRAAAASMTHRLAQAKEFATTLQLANSYRNLSAVEMREFELKEALSVATSKNIISNKALTAAQLRLLVAEKQLTRDSAARLIALGRITPMQARYLVQQKLITTADLRAALAARKHGVSINLLGTKVKIASFGFKLLGASIASAGKAMLAMLAHPATLAMAAIGSLVALWQHNSEEMDKAKAIGDNIFTKATEGADNLADVLKDLKPAESLSNLELSRGVEQLQQAVKDYSPNSIEDINNSLVDQSGHVRTLAEQYKFLLDRVAELKTAYEDMSNSSEKGMSSAVEGAIKATDGNWFTQMFDDNIISNAKDYSNALKDAQDSLAELGFKHSKELRRFIDTIEGNDKAFAEFVKNMTSYEEKFKALETFDNGKYLENTLGTGDSVKVILNVKEIKDTYEELSKDTDKFIEDMNSRLRSLEINPELMTDAQKTELTLALKQILDSMDGAGDDAKAIIAKKWEEAWGVIIMEDKVSPAIQSKFVKMAKDSADASIGASVRKMQYEGYDKLSKAEREVVGTLMDKAKTQVMSELELTNNEMDEYLKTHPLKQIIEFSVVKDGNAPSDLAKEIVGKKGYPGLTNDIDTYVRRWTKSNNVYESRNTAQQALQDAKNELEAAKKAGVGIESAQKEWDKVWNALQYLGWTDLATKDQKPNKHPKGSQKDSVAESLKQRFKDIKDAWSEFQKWSKTEGREAAAARIGESGLFSTLSKDKIPQTVEQYRALVADLEKELKAAGVEGHSQRESLLNDLLKQLLDIDKTVVDEQLRLALDKVSREADRQLADWNLFDRIRKATGNQDLAMSIAFGMNTDAETDYPVMVKKRFDSIAKASKSTLTFDTATPELLADAPEEVRKAWEKAYDLIQKYRDKEREDVVNMVEQYRSTQEEIVALTAEAEEKKRKIRESKNLTPVEKQQIIDKIDADLNYEVFRKSGEYLKFFNAILSMTGSEAENVGQKIKEALDDKLKAGQISAKDYCDEMEKIDKQLEKIRQKQKGFGGLGSFAKGGLQQMFKDRFEQAQSDYNAATQNYDTAKQQFDLFSKEGNEAGMQQVQSAMNAAGAMKEGAASAMQGAQGAMQTMAVINTIVHGINDTVQGIKGSFDLIADMADSFGVDTSADTGWGAAGAFLDAFSQASQHATNAWDSLKSGNVGGVIQGVVGSITSWFTVFNQWHDAKLQKQIERSKEAAQILQNQYDILEKRMANFLGNAAAMNTGVEGGAYGKQRELMKGQLAELEKQRQAEIDKKKTDDSVVADYNQQIEEMKIQIRDFALEAANSIYSIDLNGWAEQLGDSLVDAFAAGEDAAEAFDKTVGNIMRDVTSKMISQDILAPMFGDLRNYLFGENGMGGAFGTNFKLDASEVAAMKEYLDKIKNEGIPAAENLFNAINDATGGMLNDTENAKSGLSAGIQSVTEDTADLLASYVNAIRASVAMNEGRWDRLLGETMPQISVIAQSQLDYQRQIAENTMRNAVAAEMIVQYSKSIDDRLRRAQADKSTGFWLK